MPVSLCRLFDVCGMIDRSMIKSGAPTCRRVQVWHPPQEPQGARGRLTSREPMSGVAYSVSCRATAGRDAGRAPRLLGRGGGGATWAPQSSDVKDQTSGHLDIWTFQMLHSKLIEHNVNEWHNAPPTCTKGQSLLARPPCPDFLPCQTKEGRPELRLRPT